MVLKSNRGGFDIWMRPCTEGGSNEYHYEFVILYVDGMMAVSHEELYLK